MFPLRVRVRAVSVKKVVLHFSEDISNQPVICRLVRQFDLEFNILKANIDFKKEGLLILELKGKDENLKKGFDYLKDTGVKIQQLSQDIIRNEKRCIDCGVCIPLCPSGALEMEKNSRIVFFNAAKCIACEVCIDICPHKAIEGYFY